MEEDEIELRVCTLDGKSTTAIVKPQETIGGLKMLLQQKNDFPPALPPQQFHLFFRGLKLNMCDPIQSLGLTDGEIVVLMPYARKKQAATVFQRGVSCGLDCRVSDVSDCSQLIENEVAGLRYTLDDLADSKAMKGAENATMREAAVIGKTSGWQEKLNPEQKHLNNPSMDISDAVWNAIAADLSAWKESVVSLDKTDAHSASIPDMTREHEKETLHDESGSVNIFLPMDTGVPPGTKRCDQTVGNPGYTRKRPSSWNADENLTQGRKGIEVTVTSTQTFAQDSNNSDDSRQNDKERQSEESKHSQCFSHGDRDSINAINISELKSQKRAKSSWSCPTVLERQYQMFRALNLVSGFLLKQNMQGTWQNMKAAVRQLCEARGEQIQVLDVEMLAVLFPKLVQISHRIGEGENLSFNIDLLDPSKVPHQSIPRSLHEVMPLELQKGIGSSDLLPSAGGKHMSESRIKNAIQKRQRAFEAAVDHLIKQFQGSQTCGKSGINGFTLDDLLHFTKKLSQCSDENANQKLDVPLPRPPRQNKKLVRCMDTTDLSASEMIEHLEKGLGSLGQIVHCQIIEQREAKYGQLAVCLSNPTIAALKKLHITKLYIHQTEAINAAFSNQHVIVATSTASGKSICYNVPVLDDLFCNPESCSLYLFPTKALAQDQFRALLEMTSGLEPSINMGVYDGDTPQHQRLNLRDQSRLLITNPDMLHVSILPSHKQFERLLSNLRFVVIDEAHAYRGAFGCHTAVILRRLRRLCYHLYGREPIFIVSSATVANPREHAMELIGLRTIQVVQEDGSPCGKKYVILWNPPIYYTTKTIVSAHDSKEGGRSSKKKKAQKKQLLCRRSSPMVEVSSLLSEMVQHNLRCLSFCKTRKLSELVLNYTREILKETAPNLVSLIRAYRAGYMAQERRDIEGDLFGGRLRAVAATNALELGVDVGSLDATLHLGFPGTVASLWQQAGRAGRREKPSLAIYVAFESPLDQYFMKHPGKLFSRAIEHAQIDASNPQVLEEHIACASVEHPLNVHYDEEFFGSGLQTIISRLVKKGCMGRHPDRSSQDDTWDYIGQEKSPAQSVSIRAIDPEKYMIINQSTNQVIEEVEGSKAFFEVYEGAVYIHQGKTYLVKTLDLGAKVAICQEADLKYYTKTRDYTDVHVIGSELAYPRKISNHKYPTTTAQASLCKVTTRWIGFRRIWQGTNQTFDSVDLFLPDYSYESQAAWIRVPHSIREELDKKMLPFRAGLHAASHALLNIMPLYILCNPSDLGTECANPHDTRYFPERLLIFDRHPGGIGIAAQAQPLFAELLQAAVELLVSCECLADGGCPNCVQYLACSEYNEVVNKHAAIIILQGVIDAEESYRQGKNDKPSEDVP